MGNAYTWSPPPDLRRPVCRCDRPSLAVEDEDHRFNTDRRRCLRCGRPAATENHQEE